MEIHFQITAVTPQTPLTEELLATVVRSKIPNAAYIQGTSRCGNDSTRTHGSQPPRATTPTKYATEGCRRALDCVRFRDEVQAPNRIYRRREDVVNAVNMEPPSVRQVTTAPPPASPSPFSPKPSAIQSPLAPKPITSQVPSWFPYQNDSAVPWRYDYPVVPKNPGYNSVGAPLASASSSQFQEKSQSVANATTATDISGVGGMTRSGRYYTPEYLERLRKGKLRTGEGLLLLMNEA